MSTKLLIEYRKTSIFRCGAEAIVNPVNCVGVSGAGLARQFKTRFPENFAKYKASCDRGDLRPGAILVTFTGRQDRNPYAIVNFPTKDHFSNPSREHFVERGLESLRCFLGDSDIASVAVPALGCGLGGLAWSTVGPMIERALGDLDMRVIVLSLIER